MRTQQAVERRNDRAEALWMALAPALGRLTLAVLAAIVAMWLFVELADEVREGTTRTFDVGVLQLLRSYQQPLLTTGMYWISWLGGPQFQPWFFVACLLGLVAARRFWPDGLAFLLAGVGGVGLMYGLKRLFQRARPEAIFDSLGYSFPSGHSFFALVLYCMLAYFLARGAPLPRRRWIWAIAITATLLMGLSRIYLGEHFPTDVAAGFAVGVPWVWGCLALPSAFQRRGRTLSLEERRNQDRAAREHLREVAQCLPALAKLATQLSRDQRVPPHLRMVTRLLAAYLKLPFDVIPNVVPGLGVLDDLFLSSVTLRWVMRTVPAEAIWEHWQEPANLSDLLEEIRLALRALWQRD